MYSREINGDEFTFGVSGKLIRNTLVMYDRQTNSLWGQILGRAIDGPLTGTELEFVPAVHLTWAAWREQHPDTLALIKGYSGNYDSYTGYYSSGSAGVIGETFRDDRLYTKEFVIGVAVESEAVAYPFSVLNQETVVNDTIGEQNVLVVFSPASGAGIVFDRNVDGASYTFIENGDGTLFDEETGSVWDATSGEATEGPLAGSMLARVKSTAVFWFGWKDWYPTTRVYGLNS